MFDTLLLADVYEPAFGTSTPASALPCISEPLSRLPHLRPVLKPRVVLAGPCKAGKRTDRRTAREREREDPYGFTRRAGFKPPMVTADRTHGDIQLQDTRLESAHASLSVSGE